jgi:hypothetical protein
MVEIRTRRKYVPPWEKTDYSVWGLQKELLKEQIPSHGKIIEIIYGISDIRTKALFILEYLTAGRVTELCNGIEKDNKGKPMGVRDGITKKNIEYVKKNGRDIILINLHNNKNKRKRFKFIPVPVDKEPELLKQLNLYLQTKTDDEVLFDFGKIRAYQLIRAATGWNNHYIRHVRLSHLVMYYDFNDQLLVQYAGWDDARPAKYYVMLRWSDILDKL